MTSWSCSHIIGCRPLRETRIYERGNIMSCNVNEIFLEQKFEEGLALGMSEAQAEAYANKCFEEQGD